MNKILIALIIILSFSGCDNKKANKLSWGKDLTFADFVDIDKIEKVKITNNSGTFYLNNNQLIKLKKELAKLTYEPDQDIKVGAKGIILTISGKEHYLNTRTNGEYAETDTEIATKNTKLIDKKQSLVFKVNGLNLDNYE